MQIQFKKVKITISYKKHDEPVEVITLAPEEYFDALEEGETFEEHSVPKFNYAKDYLNVSDKNLEWTEIKILGTTEDRTIRTDFYNAGKSFMSQRNDVDGYQEIIVVTTLSETNSHIVRIHKENNSIWQINYNGIIEDLADGTQREIRFD